MTELGGLARGLLEPLVDPTSRTFLPSLLLAALVAAAFHLVRHRHALPDALRTLPRYVLAPHLWTHRSTVLDVQIFLLRRLLAVLGVVPALASAWWIATALVRALDAFFGVPSVPALPVALISAVYTAALFVAWDASRFLLHRAMHEVPALWELHAVHHSAEVLTPLTFHRIHPLESALYEARGAIVGGVMAGVFFWLFRGEATQLSVLGVHAFGFLLDAATGNLRHSHVWLGFGPRVEAWLMSPAQHQLHHSADPEEHGCNYGTWLSLWDRLGGTLRVAGPRPPRAFGLGDGGRSHDDLISALVRPVVGAGRALLGAPSGVAAALLACGDVARAEDAGVDAPSVEAAPEGPAPVSSGPPPEEEDDRSLELIVESRGGVPRVAGSAHVVDEADLARDEYDDIHRVLAEVPGVYVRGEDGFGLRPNIGIRGANSDRSAKVTLMEDGVLLAPAPYAAPAAYYFPMATRLVGVEVYKGPASTRFGPHTVGGAVNLLTRSAPSAPAGALDVAVGLNTTIKAHGWAGTGGPRAGFVAEGVHLSTEGFKDLDGGGPTGFDHQEVMLKGKVNTDPDAPVVHSVELKAGYARERSHETYLGLSLDDFAATPYRRYAASQNDLMTWQRSQAELSWRVEGRSFDLRTVAYHHYLTRQWTRLAAFAGGPDLHDLLLSSGAGQAGVFAAILRGEEDTASADQVLQVATNDRRFHAFGVQTVGHWSAHSDVVASRLEFGVRVHSDLVRRVHTEDPFDMRSGVMVPTGGPTETTLDSDSDALAVAAHLHEDLSIGRVRLLPGVRVEAIRTHRANVGEPEEAPQWRVIPLPGMAIFGSPTRWLDLFAGAHRGFSPVAPGEPAEAQPESSWSYELGGRVASDGTRADLVGFFNDYVNLTGQCTLSGGCNDDQIDRQFSGGKAFVWGIEALVGQSVRLPKRLTLEGELTWTWTGSRFRTGFVSEFPQFGSVAIGDALPYVPEQQGSARISLTHPRGSLSIGGHLRGPMRDVAGQGPIPTDELIPLSFLLDLAAHVQVTPVVEGYVTVNNLANSVTMESLRPFGARPSMPIQAMFGVKVTPRPAR